MEEEVIPVEKSKWEVVKLKAEAAWTAISTNPIYIGAKTAVRGYPYLAFFLFAGLVIALYFAWPTFINEHRQAVHEERQEENRVKTEELKIEAAELNAETQVLKKEAQKAEVELDKTKATIKEKKSHAEKLDKQVIDSGRADIRDADVPNNVDLCARANALGVRCDSDK